MARKKKPEGQPVGGESAPAIKGAAPTINFRLPHDLRDRVQAVADVMGIDISDVVRMILRQQVAAYERYARAYPSAELSQSAEPPADQG